MCERVKFLAKHRPHLEALRTHKGVSRDRQTDERKVVPSFRQTDRNYETMLERYKLSLNEPWRMEMEWTFVSGLKQTERKEYGVMWDCAFTGMKTFNLKFLLL